MPLRWSIVVIFNVVKQVLAFTTMFGFVLNIEKCNTIRISFSRSRTLLLHIQYALHIVIVDITRLSYYYTTVSMIIFRPKTRVVKIYNRIYS